MNTFCFEFTFLLWIGNERTMLACLVDLLWAMFATSRVPWVSFKFMVDQLYSEDTRVESNYLLYITLLILLVFGWYWLTDFNNTIKVPTSLIPLLESWQHLNIGTLFLVIKATTMLVEMIICWTLLYFESHTIDFVGVIWVFGPKDGKAYQKMGLPFHYDTIFIYKKGSMLIILYKMSFRGHATFQWAWIKHCTKFVPH